MKLRREPLDFLLPVIDQGSRAYNQGTPALPRSGIRFFLLRDKKADDLKRLSKPHIVRQNPAEPIFPQCLKPQKAALLIAAHHTLKALRHLVITVFDGLHIADHPFKLPVFLHRKSLIVF